MSHLKNPNDNAMEFDDDDHRFAQNEDAQGLTDAEIDLENSRLQYPSSDSSNLNMSGVSLTSQEQQQIHEMAQSFNQQNASYRTAVNDLETKLRERENYIRKLEANAAKVAKTPKNVQFSSPTISQGSFTDTANVSNPSPVMSKETLEMASLLDSIKAEVQTRDTPVLSENDVLKSSDILQSRTIAIVSNSHPRNPLVDKDFNELRDVMSRLVQKLSGNITDGSENTILRFIRHYGGLLLVCPNEMIMTGLLKFNSVPDRSRSFGSNGGTYVLKRFDVSLFSNTIAVITNNFAISSACDFANNLNSALSPAQWTQIGEGKPDARNDDIVIHEFHVPSADYAIIQNELLNNRVYDDDNNYYKF